MEKLRIKKSPSFTKIWKDWFFLVVRSCHYYTKNGNFHMQKDTWHWGSNFESWFFYFPHHPRQLTTLLDSQWAIEMIWIKIYIQQLVSHCFPLIIRWQGREFGVIFRMKVSRPWNDNKIATHIFSKSMCCDMYICPHVAF